MKVNSQKNKVFLSKKITKLFFISILIVAISSCNRAINEKQHNVITLNSTKTFQTISGWEATAWGGQGNPDNPNPAFPNFKNELYDKVVNNIGINRLRIEVECGVEQDQDYFGQIGKRITYSDWRVKRTQAINDNNDPNLINWNGFHFSSMDDRIDKIVMPIKQLVEANGEKLHINLNYVAFTAQFPGPYHHDDPDEYAEFILATFLHIQSKYGWVPDSLEVILEPDNVSEWDGKLIGQAIVATARKLKANGFTPQFIAPSNTNMRKAIKYFDRMIQVPGVLQHLSEFSYHRYSNVSMRRLRAIAKRAVKYGVNTSMLEWWDKRNNHHVLHEDLKIGRNSAWQQSTANGFHHIDITDTNNPIITIKEETKFTRQYFKFIRSGAVRIEATTNNEEFDPLAFINTDGKYVVVVKADTGGAFSITGFPSGVYGIKYTTPTQFDVDLPDVMINAGEIISTNIPSTGVITVYAKSTR